MRNKSISMAPLPEELTKTRQKTHYAVQSNGEYTGGLDSLSMQPPELSLQSGTGNSEYDDFLDKIDPNDNLRSQLFSGVTALESVYDNYSILKVGASGNHILKVKKLLKELGFLSEDFVNEEFDSEMKSSLKSFQNYHDTILEDGIIGPETMRFLDSKAIYLERDLGECDPDDQKENIEKAREKLGEEKKEEDKKWWWDDSKSDMPEINLDVLNLYERYLNGERINDLYIPKNLPNKRYTLQFYIKNNGTREKVTVDLKGTWKDNRWYTPVNEIEMGMFAQLDQCTSEDSFLSKLKELCQEINNNIATIARFSSGYNGHAFPSAVDLDDYLSGRAQNSNDIYSCFLDTWF